MGAASIGDHFWEVVLSSQQGDRTFASTISPLWSPDRRFAVVGEGWLSNSAELAEKLGISLEEKSVKDARSFSSGTFSSRAFSSGTLNRSSHHACEIAAALWERCGINGLLQLEGMFALVVWEAETGQTWLVRDRVGACTLYYIMAGTTCTLSSRLRALNSWRSPQLDLIALRDYLCCAFVPGERTLWQDVKELRPGTCLNVPENTIINYWQPDESIISADESLDWHSQRLRSLLDTVVQTYLPTEEPVGVYLSGGLDSSCITALAAKFHAHPVHTYSIHFGRNCPNELEFSSLVARHCQTQHHILEISPQAMWDRLPDTMAVLDDPIGDPLTVPNRLMGEAAQQDVGVILNGEGGDPCFGGPKNQPMLLTQLYSKVSGEASLKQSSTSDPANQHPDRVTAYLASFHKCALDLPRLLQPDIWQQVQHAPSLFVADLQADAQYLNRLMLINIKYKGADHILTKVNNLTQAAGLMGRSPLFDQRVVAMSLEIPPDYKLFTLVKI
jgi:asparagine synthase (glutamine-hydrolysing)